MEKFLCIVQLVHAGKSMNCSGLCNRGCNAVWTVFCGSSSFGLLLLMLSIVDALVKHVFASFPVAQRKGEFYEQIDKLKNFQQIESVKRPASW